MSEEHKSPITALLMALVKEIIAHRVAMLKKKMTRYCAAVVLMLAAMTALIFGLGSFVGWLFPILPPGTGHAIVALVFALVALICAKTA